MYAVFAALAALAPQVPEEEVLWTPEVGVPASGAAVGLPPQAGWPAAFLPPMVTQAYASELAVANLDGDPEPEIVVHRMLQPLGDGELRVYDAAGNLEPGWPVVIPDDWNSHPVIGDVDGDGDGEIFVSGFAFHHDGTPLAAWPKTRSSCPVAKVPVTTVVDLDGDGDVEVLGASGMGTVFVGNACWAGAELYAWGGDGSVLPGFPVSMPVIYPPHTATLRHPVVADLDGDGDLELVVAGLVSLTTTGGIAEVYAYHHDGTTVSGWPVRIYDQEFANITVRLHMPAVVDLDSDGTDEVVIPLSLKQYGAKLIVLSGDGSDVPGWPKVLGGHTSSPVGVAAGDLDVDGHPELVVTRVNISTPTPTTETFAWNGDGSRLPGWPRAASDYWHSQAGAISSAYYWLYSEPVVADVAGVGRPEILHCMRRWPPFNGHDLLVRSADGEQVPDRVLHLATDLATSLVTADLDLDGDVEVGLVHNASGATAISFWDLDHPHSDSDPWPAWGHDAGRSYRHRDD